VTENCFLRYWFQDAVVHSYPSSAHRVTHVTGVVAPSCKLAMVVYHYEYRKGERREGGRKERGREGGREGVREGGRDKERRKIYACTSHVEGFDNYGLVVKEQFPYIVKTACDHFNLGICY